MLVKGYTLEQKHLKDSYITSAYPSMDYSSTNCGPFQVVYVVQTSSTALLICFFKVTWLVPVSSRRFDCSLFPQETQEISESVLQKSPLLTRDQGWRDLEDQFNFRDFLKPLSCMFSELKKLPFRLEWAPLVQLKILLSYLPFNILCLKELSSKMDGSVWEENATQH